eukprot:scaffold12337_cov74-Phaeocystis_antarctica.AAC.1
MCTDDGLARKLSASSSSSAFSLTRPGKKRRSGVCWYVMSVSCAWSLRAGSDCFAKSRSEVKMKTVKPYTVR